MQYNGMGEVVRTVDAKGRVSQFFYDPSNGIDLLSAKDSRGRTVASFTYNDKHLPISATDDQNRTTTYSYTAWGAISTTTDSESHVTVVNYDATSKRPMNATFDGITQGSVTYDTIGRVRTSTDITGLTLTYDYNDLNRPIRVSYPDGTYTATEYSCCSLPGITRDRAGRKTYYDYDELFNLIRVQSPDGQTLEFDYDAEGNMIRLSDAKGSKTTFAYDAIGRPTLKTYADGSIEAIGYDVPNGIISNRDAQGKVTRSFYDVVGNLTYIDYPTMADVSYKYNDLDQEVEIHDGVGTTRFTYDVEDRVKTIDGPWDDDLLTYSFDSAGRSTGMQIGTGSGISHQVGYTYDALERLSTLTSGAGTFTYNYVGDTDLLSSLDLPNGTVAEQSYDSLLRLTEVNNRKGATTLAKFNYAYDNRDIRTGVLAKLGSDPLKEIAYSYDDIDQLVGEVATGGATGSAYSNAFTYDAMGNRTNITAVTSSQTTTSASVPNALNQLTSVSRSVDGGPVQTSNLLHDLSGNLTQSVGSDGSKTLYTYDDLDRLIRVERRDEANVPIGKSEFVYDYASRKAISREFTWTLGAWVQASEKRRVFDGLDVIQERSALNEVTANYTRDGNIAGILSRSSTSGDSYYHYDGNGNVTALSDENGELVGRYSYDAFGNTLEASGTRANENPYRFSTKEWLSPVSMYDYGYRFYSPSMGRWVNRDPIRESGGINIYGMIGNNPVNGVDSYGLSWLQDWVDSWLSPPKVPCPDDEDPAWALAQEKVNVDRHVVKRGAEMSKTAYENIGVHTVIAGSLFKAGSGVRTLSKAANSGKNIWSANRARSNVANALHHWNQHRKEFPELQNSLQYVKAANKFVSSPPVGTLSKTTPDGYKFFYYGPTNTFANTNPQGVVETFMKPGNPSNYFKPFNGLDYYLRQK